MNRICIVGAGVSGLILASHLSKSIKAASLSSFVTLYESNSQPGGRILTRTFQNKETSQIYYLDLGANLIDFSSDIAYYDCVNLLPKNFVNNLLKFNRPFLVYENQKFRKGDYEKNRYFYKGGFNKLIENLLSQIEVSSAQIFFNQQIQKIQFKDKKKVRLTIKDKGQDKLYEQQFSKVYFSCPTSIALQLIEPNQNEKLPQMQKIVNYCKEIKYTKQLSVAFATLKNIKHQFSCILFKNHPVLTFICSHQQKYGQNTYVAQLSTEFSEKYYESPEEAIAKLVFESLPKQIKKITCEEYLLVHKWPISLINPMKKIPVPPYSEHFQFVGDSQYGKSSVSNSIRSVKKIVTKL